jgi:hypothetical protein
MSNFALIRGWLECSFDEVEEIRSKVEIFAVEAVVKYDPDYNLKVYLNSWHYPNPGINWTAIIFYGADVKSEAVPIIKEMLSLATLVGDEVRGIFYVDDEENDPVIWKISEGEIREEPRSDE